MANESETNIFYSWIVYPVNLIFSVAAFVLGVIALLCLLGAGIIGLAAAYIGYVALKTVINTSTALISFPFNALNVLFSHLDAFLTKKLNKIDNTFLKYTLGAIFSILDTVIFIPVRCVAITMNIISRYLCLPDIASLWYQLKIITFLKAFVHRAPHYYYTDTNGGEKKSMPRYDLYNTEEKLKEKAKKVSIEDARKEILSEIENFQYENIFVYYLLIVPFALVKWDIYCFDYIHNLFSPLGYKDACNERLASTNSKFDRVSESIKNNFESSQLETSTKSYEDMRLNDSQKTAISGVLPDFARRDIEGTTEFSYLRENPDRHLPVLTMLYASVAKKLNQIEYFLMQLINRFFLITQQCLDLLLLPIKKFNTYVLGGMILVFGYILHYIAPSALSDGFNSVFYIPVVAPLLFVILCALPLLAIAGWDDLELTVFSYYPDDRSVVEVVRSLRWLSYGLVSLLLWPIEHVTMVVFKIVFQLILLPIELIAICFSELTPFSPTDFQVRRTYELMHDNHEETISDEFMRSSDLTQSPLISNDIAYERKLGVLEMHATNIERGANNDIQKQKRAHENKVHKLEKQIDSLTKEKKQLSEDYNKVINENKALNNNNLGLQQELKRIQDAGTQSDDTQAGQINVAQSDNAANVISPDYSSKTSNNGESGQDPDLNPSLHGDSPQVQGGGNRLFDKQSKDEPGKNDTVVGKMNVVNSK